MSDKPKTAYDVRRYVTLVQLLANYEYDDNHLHHALMQLATDWNVPLRDDAPMSWLADRSTQQIISVLSQFVVRFHSTEPSKDTWDKIKSDMMNGLD